MATIEASTPIPVANSGLLSRLSRFSGWIGGTRSIRVLEISSIILLVGMAVATAWLLNRNDEQAVPLSPSMAAVLLVLNLLPAAALIVFFGRRLALRRARHVNVGNTKLLHVRLVAIFSLIASVPTMLLVVFASVLFQSGAQFWFSGSAKSMLENAGELAQGYYSENVKDVRDKSLAMAGDLRFMLDQTRPDNPEFQNAYIGQVLTRELSESAVVSVGNDGVQRTAVYVSPDDDPKRNWINAAQLKQLKNGEDIVVSVKPDRIEVVTILYRRPLTYLYASRAASVATFKLGEKAQSVLTDYEALVSRSRVLQLQFNATLYVVSLLIIAITVWIALLVADKLVRPVNALVQAAQKIADGDLSARVDENNITEDEVGFLSKSFNRMTERLENQTSKFVTANKQLDDRRAFIEAVLESVSAGVVSVDDDGVVKLANTVAEKLLAGNNATIVGQRLKNISPALAEITVQHQTQAVVQLGEGPEPRTVAVKTAVREGGQVVTFEDISQQLSDQRRAAWSDVARRIAHEIKNPLTPIQLAAERLQRRFGKQIDEGSAVFEQLTSTIVRQVGDLRKIVDEFSSFARMPKPLFRVESLTDIIGHAVFLFEVAHTNIQFEFDQSSDPYSLVCDRRQLGQAITNILKNAVEAIDEKAKHEDFIAQIGVFITERDDQIIVTFKDNGPGLPTDRDRIVEPYVTTRTSGSGLGLAIVKNIVEEHFGVMEFADADGGGAIITVRFRPQVLANAADGIFEKPSKIEPIKSAGNG